MHGICRALLPSVRVPDAGAPNVANVGGAPIAHGHQCPGCGHLLSGYIEKIKIVILMGVAVVNRRQRRVETLQPGQIGSLIRVDQEGKAATPSSGRAAWAPGAYRPRGVSGAEQAHPARVDHVKRIAQR